MINPVKAAFSPGGMRIGRLDYLFSWVVSTLILGAAAVLTLVVLAVVFAASMQTMGQADDMLRGMMPLITLMLILPASIYTGAVLGVKRLHDIGRTGRWMVLYYACYAACLFANLIAVRGGPYVLVAQALGVVTTVALLLLAALPGSPKENEYGPVPPKF